MAKEVAKMKAAEGRIRRRVELSKELVKQMGMSPEAYVRVAVNAFVMNPALVDCSHDSIDKAILRCVEIGLVPDGKHAAMIPFKKQAQLVVMIDGKATLARRALPGLALRARTVFDGEHFEHMEGLEPVLEHMPDPTVSHDDADIKAVYAVAHLPGGANEFVVLYRHDIERAKGFSRARGGPWSSGFYREMAEKTALHRLLKRLPTVADAPPDFDEVQDEPAEPRIMGGGGHYDNTGLQGSQAPAGQPSGEGMTDADRQAAGLPSAEPEQAQGNVQDAPEDDKRRENRLKRGLGVPVQDADQGQAGASDAFDGATDGSPF